MEPLLKATIRLPRAYLKFLIAFVLRPAREMHRYSGRPEIDKQLLSFVLVALVLSDAILFVTPPFIPQGESTIAHAVLGRMFSVYLSIRWFKPMLIPLLVIVTITLLLGVSHLIAVSWFQLMNIGFRRNPLVPVGKEFHLGGSVWDTINGGLGCAALYLPVFTLGLVVDTVSQVNPNLNSFAVVSCTTGLELALLYYYLPAALSGTHRGASFAQAFAASAFSAAVLAVVVKLIR